MTIAMCNEQQLQKIKSQPGFIAALDQSGGSTPIALRDYGIKDGAWSSDEEMFARVIAEMPAVVSIDSPLSIPFGRTRVEDDDPGRKVLVPDVRVDRSPKRRGAKSAKPSAALSVTQPLIVPTLMDEEVEEAFLKIIHVESGELVAIIEILSMYSLSAARSAIARSSSPRQRRCSSPSAISRLRLLAIVMRFTYSSATGRRWRS